MYTASQVSVFEVGSRERHCIGVDRASLAADVAQICTQMERARLNVYHLCLCKYLFYALALGEGVGSDGYIRARKGQSLDTDTSRKSIEGYLRKIRRKRECGYGYAILKAVSSDRCNAFGKIDRAKHGTLAECKVTYLDKRLREYDRAEHRTFAEGVVSDLFDGGKGHIY